MNKSNVVGLAGREFNEDPLAELIRQGARQLIQQAVEPELAAYLEAFQNR